MIEKAIKEEASKQLAMASIMPGAIGNAPGNFYMPQSNTIDQINQRLGIFPDKLLIPREYHEVINMCYDFYQRGGIIGTVVNRLAELSITRVENGQRGRSDEENSFFEALLFRKPTRLHRFIHSMALEYFLSGMVLPRIDWETIPGSELSPELISSKIYTVPVVDMYPPKLILVSWIGWGKKEFRLKIPDKDIKLIKNEGGKIKDQQQRYLLWQEQYPAMVQAVNSGQNSILLDTDAILRKEVSFTEYPTPYLFNVLEALTFKQQLRRMDYATAARIINAILLVTEGDKDFPITEETRGNLDELKTQITAYTSTPSGTQRLFALFSNHTTKLQWISPDVAAMLNQDKYREVNEELQEGLGLAKILVTGESGRSGQAAEVSTWAIQPMMEDLRTMILEWLTPVYEEAARRNNFTSVPEPMFSPIKLQDFIKTAAVFAAAFKEGNVSRTTRDGMMGLNFQAEVELMKDERKLMVDLDTEAFPAMPYNVLAPPGGGGIGGGMGRPPGAPNDGGRPLGTQNPPITVKNRGVNIPGQEPTSKLSSAGINEEIEFLSDDDFIDLVNRVAEERGLYLSADPSLAQ